MLYMKSKVKLLHRQLVEAYSAENLNRISVTLIGLYKEGNNGTLREIAAMINETSGLTIENDSRLFSKLMMLYHPDRGQYHRGEIDRLAATDDYDRLLEYSHILLLGRLEDIASRLAIAEDIDYSPVYEWDFDTEGFRIMDLNNSPEYENKTTVKKARKFFTFYEAFQMRMTGTTSIDFPPYYLEDIEEIELSQSGVDDLQGVQYCIHAKEMDLSGNSISDISLLWGLSNLEKLDLSDNRISVIDTLSNLRNINSLNLSYNPVNDISALIELSNLEYVELTATKVSRAGIMALEELGITVVL